MTQLRLTVDICNAEGVVYGTKDTVVELDDLLAGAAKPSITVNWDDTNAIAHVSVVPSDAGDN